MIKALLPGAAAAALLAPSAAAARAEPLAWVISPTTDSCRTELELTGASGAVATAALVSDGEKVALVFAKADAPERAFLPIRIDHRPYANLVLRQADGRTAAMELSAETLGAIRKGAWLQIGWLADEPVEARLTGSDQALADLKTCGAQVAQRFRAQQAAAHDAAERAQAEARAKALADEQVAAARAQRDAAEAQAQRDAAEAERLKAQAEAERQRSQAEAEAAREQAEERAHAQADAEAYPYARAGDYRNDPRDGYDRYGYPPAYGAYRGW